MTLPAETRPETFSQEELQRIIMNAAALRERRNLPAHPTQEEKEYTREQLYAVADELSIAREHVETVLHNLYTHPPEMLADVHELGAKANSKMVWDTYTHLILGGLRRIDPAEEYTLRPRRYNAAHVLFLPPSDNNEFWRGKSRRRRDRKRSQRVGYISEHLRIRSENPLLTRVLKEVVPQLKERFPHYTPGIKYDYEIPF